MGVRCGPPGELTHVLQHRCQCLSDRQGLVRHDRDFGEEFEFTLPLVEVAKPLLSDLLGLVADPALTLLPAG